LRIAVLGTRGVPPRESVILTRTLTLSEAKRKGKRKDLKIRTLLVAGDPSPSSRLRMTERWFR